MDGYTNYAYRQIVRQLGGVGLPATEMISARGFVHTDGRHEEPNRLWGVKDEPRPLAVQIWDNEPELLAAAGARLAREYRASAIDINFGCPVKRVTKKAKSGSYLLRRPDLVGRIVESVVGACHPTPVTAKIRLGYTRDTINAIDVAQAIEAAGAAGVTVHGRTAGDMFRGFADWSRIAEIKPHLKRMALVGNGDLHSVGAVLEAFRRYGVDGVMVGRAGLARPWLFRQVQAALRGEPVPVDLTLHQQRQLLLDHYRLLGQRMGPARACLLMRRYACCYAQGYPGARAFRNHVVRVCTPDALLEVVQRYFPCGEA
jgi:tRNA-dihydrouridine synthase B